MTSRFSLFAFFLCFCYELPGGKPQGLCVSSEERPTPKANPMIIDGLLRLTIYNDYCMRIEKGTFHDEMTPFAARPEITFQDFEIEDTEEQILVKTKKMIFFVDRKRFGKRMNDWDYGVHMPGIAVWRGSQGATDSLHNLGGSTGTLDEKSGPFKLNDGLLTKEGYFVLDDSKAPLIENGWVKPREDDELACDYYVFCYGKDFARGIKTLCDVSGRVPLPPRYCFGSWYSRWARYSSEDYRKIVSDYKEKGYPLDILVWDMEWHDRKNDKGLGHAGTYGWTGWSWNRELLPDAEALLKEMHEQGIKIALNVHPADGIRDKDFCYEDFMKALGESTEGGRIIPFQAGNQAYMEAYFKYAHEPLEKEGADIWWVDWQQDYFYPHVSGVPGLKHWTWLNRLYYEHTDTPTQRGLSLARWGGFGDQKHPIEFSGDAACTWEMLEFQVALTAVSANEGCCYWSHDMGGFYGQRNPEQYARWLQFGATTAALRLHSSGKLDRLPWKWEGEAGESLQESFELRSQLLPYIYTAAHKLYDEGLPFLRQLYYDYPEDENAYKNPQEYLLGEKILSAPITRPGRGEHCLGFQAVYFPEDGFANFFTGESYNKGFALCAADLHEFPLFVKKGTPLPLGRMGSRMAALPPVLDLMVFPTDGDGTGEFTLYEDDGVTPAYKEGAFALTEFQYARQGNLHTLKIGEQKGDFAGQIKNRAYSVVFRNIAKVEALFVNGKKAEPDFDPVSRTVVVELPESFAGSVKLEAETADAKIIAQEQKNRRRALLPEDDAEGHLLAQGCGVASISETRYFLEDNRVWRFFPGGICNSFTILNEETGSEISYQLKNNETPEILPTPPKGKVLTLKAEGVTFQFPKDL